MDNEIFLGRQPILNIKSEIVGYEMLFRSQESLSHAKIKDGLAASTNVIVGLMSHFGFEAVLGKNIAYINVNAELLMSDTIELLPSEGIVLEILEDVTINSALIERCKELKAKGFLLALDDLSYQSEHDAILPWIDVIKIDFLATPIKDMAPVISQIQKHSSAVFLAEKIETEEMFETAKKLGFSLFQGHFFSKPTLLRGKRVHAQQTSLMHIISVLFGDASVNELEPLFKNNPELTFGLLRLVNSVGIGGVRTNITTLRQALVVLGQKQLLRWMMLLVYAGSGGSPPVDLIQRVLNRARFMELLAQHENFNYADMSEQAFMVGMFSLAQTVCESSLEELLEQVNLADYLKIALLKKEGGLGQALLLTEALEVSDFKRVDTLRRVLGLSVNEITTVQLQAIEWTNSFKQQLA